ncbi:MAG: hypothetical protein ACD_41C00224G0004 [uncultured bacterium]|nr:MAG: hypothetical protein ACD_41C00224G0004 [uncultured bacterium]HBY73990.1 hypothetical protein [Candidatus Kerfeldbacteria bacterium]
MRIKISVLLSLSLLPNLVLAKNVIDGESFGANIHLRQRHVEEDWDDVLTLADTYGITWAREQFNWDVIEPTDDDAFNFDTYDAVIDTYEAHEIEVVGLLTYSSSWASDNPGAVDYEFYPPDLDAWSDYVETVTEHYAGRITYWEIWNEPNHASFWKGDESDYADLFNSAVTAAQAGNPDAKIVFGGLSGADYAFLEDVLPLIDNVDDIAVMAIHPYSNYAPEVAADGVNTLTTDLYNVKAVLNRFEMTRTPIWLTEIGWQTGTDGVANRTQAEYLTRAYTQALAIPDVEKIFWYSLVDAGSDFGLIDDDFVPKEAASALGFVAEELTGHWFKDQTLPGVKIMDNFVKSQGWHFAGTVCTEGSLDDNDNGKMTVRYRFTADTNCYAPITLDKALPYNTRALQFKVKGDNNSTALRVRVVDATGETFQYNFGYLPKEWLYYTVQLTKPSSWWNGDGDGKLDQPLTFDSFVLDDADGLQEKGTAQFDELLVSGRSQVYLYRFHQGTKDKYAYWSTSRVRRLRILLDGAGKIEERIWRYEDKRHKSGDGYYWLRARNAVTFLQTR